MARKNLEGAVAVVTGAGSGIGRALAVQLAPQGTHLALVDRDPQGLSATAGMIGDREHRTSEHVCDVSLRGSMEAMAQDVFSVHGHVDLVINNAGIVQFERIADMTYDNLEKLMNVNFWGVIHGSKVFLPHFLERGSGHIVNISSLAGFITMPLGGAYSASKFAVRAFTETLWQEVRGAGVDVTCVHPSVVATNIARSAHLGDSVSVDREAFVALTNRFAANTPERTARKIIGAIRRRRLRILIGADAILTYHLLRLFPVSMIRLATHFTRMLER